MTTKRTYILLLGILLLLLIGSCTPTSNTFYNRQFQPVSTKYNVLYHSEEAFTKGKKELAEKYKDNFNEILPVEPTAISDDVKLRGEEDPNFERAEEKAIKTIQKHSMVYKGKQRNYKIDDAYMMLGKARYFNERFIPALEAFNHLLDSYGESNRLGDAAIWREKTNLRLGKNQIALKNLQVLLDTLEMKRNTEADARATLAQAHINLKQFEAAVGELEQAAALTRDKKHRGRYYFIAGQLHEKLKDKKSAVDDYEKVVKLNWKIPRRLWIEAQGRIANNKDFTKEEKQDYLKYLSRLENRYEHKDFLDVLYHNHARLLQKDNKNEEAISFYEKSVENNKENPVLKSETYRNLAELYFSDKKYVEAFNNYAEALKLTPENTLEHLYLKRKRDNLKKVTTLENIVRQADSLMKIEHMTEVQRTAYFKKQKDSLAQVNNKLNDSSFKGNLPLISFTDNQDNTGKFYFYNPTTVAYGKQNFRRKWGDRILQDNWRRESSIAKKKVSIDTLSGDKNPIKINQDTSLSLPNTEEVWKAIHIKRNDALYRLGVLYESQFKDYDLAINRLEKVLKSDPSQDLRLASSYELYRIYNQLNKKEADAYKNLLLSQYPDSDYALILANKNLAGTKENALKELYKTSLKDLEEGKYEKVEVSINPKELKVHKTDLASQLLLLRAKAIARLEGVKAYEKELRVIQNDYPESLVVKKIDTILTNLSSLLEDKKFDKSKGSSWKIVVRNIPKDSLDMIETIYKNKLDLLSKSLKITQDLYNRKETWIVIHRIKDANTATFIIKELEPLTRRKEEIFVISSENYRKVQAHKSVNKYLID